MNNYIWYVGDTKEGYYICRHVDANSEEATLPLHGPNVFPDEASFPHFRRVTTSYFNTMSQLGYEVAQILGKALDAPEFFAQPGILDKYVCES